MLSPRLREILGAEFESITEKNLDKLVLSGTTEDQDIDFKAANYDFGPKGNFELSKDICGMANHLGGVLIIGVREADGCAVELTPITTDEKTELRIRQVIAERAFPMPQDVKVRQIPTIPPSPKSYYIILVPRSPDAPHGVLDRLNDQRRNMCWPIRNGSSTRFLHETELATRYRDRFTFAQRQIDRLSELHEQGTSRGEPGQIVTVTVDMGLVPTTPGNCPPESISKEIELFLESTQWWTRGLPVAQNATNFLPRRKRIRLETGNGRFELHSDGSAWGRVFVGSPAAQSNTPIRLNLIDFEQKIKCLVGFLGSYACRTGAGGDALISMVIGKQINKKLYLLRDAETILGETTGAVVPPIELTASLNGIQDPKNAGRIAYLLARDVEQDLGIPLPVILQEDGSTVHNIS